MVVSLIKADYHNGVYLFMSGSADADYDRSCFQYRQERRKSLFYPISAITATKSTK